MRAVGVTEFGGPEALHVVELPEPQACPGEMRIRVRAAAVNPTDTLIRSGARAQQLKDIPPPHVPGMDVAGVLDQIGADVTTGLRIGDRVMAIVVPSGSHGAYSEFVVVPAGSVARAPAGATVAEAATLPMNGLTVRLALDVLDLQPGQTLAVSGPAGAVGGYAVQLGKAAGLRVIAGALLDHLAIPAARDGGRIATVRGFRGSEERGTTCHPVLVRSYAREQAKLDQLPAGRRWPDHAAGGRDLAGRSGRGGAPPARGRRGPGPAGPGVLTAGRCCTGPAHQRQSAASFTGHD